MSGVDGAPFGNPPSRGALELGDIFGAVQRGTHLIQGDFNGQTWADAEVEEGWALTAAGDDSPLISQVTMVDGDPVFWTNQPLVEGITYTLTPLADFGGVTPSAVVFVGMPVSQPARDPGPELVDFDTGPLIEMGKTPSGDFAKTSGIVTLRRIVDDRLLTLRRSLSWAPEYGADWRHKGLVPGDLASIGKRAEVLLRSIPYVDEVRVAVSYRDRELEADVDIRSTLGDLRDTVRL